MLTFVAVVHILVALLLITLVLMQDSKGGGAAGAFGGGGSNSLLGATGATTLFEKMTRWTGILFAITCILLTVLTVQKNKSVVDSYETPAAPVEAPAQPQTEAPQAPATDAQPAAEAK